MADHSGPIHTGAAGESMVTGAGWTETAAGSTSKMLNCGADPASARGPSARRGRILRVRNHLPRELDQVGVNGLK